MTRASHFETIGFLLSFSAVCGLFFTSHVIACVGIDEVCEMSPIEPIDRIRVIGRPIEFPQWHDPFYGWGYSDYSDLYDENLDPLPEPTPQPEHQCTVETHVSQPFTLSQTIAYNGNVTFRQGAAIAIGTAIGGIFGNTTGATIGALIGGWVAAQVPKAHCGWRIETNVTICDETSNFFDGQYVEIPHTVRSTSSGLVNYGDGCVDDTIVEPPPCASCDLNGTAPATS